MRFSAAYGRLPWPARGAGGAFLLRRRARRRERDVRKPRALDVRGRRGARAAREQSPSSNRRPARSMVSLEDFLEGVRTRPEAAPLARNVAAPLGLRPRRPAAARGAARPPRRGVGRCLWHLQRNSPSSSSSLPPLSIASGRFTASDDAIRVEDVEARMLDASLRVSGAWNGYREGRSADHRGDGGRRDSGPRRSGGDGSGRPFPRNSGRRRRSRSAASASARGGRRAFTGRRLRRRERAPPDSRPGGRRKDDRRPRPHDRSTATRVRPSPWRARGGGYRRAVPGNAGLRDDRNGSSRSGRGAAARSRATSGRTFRREASVRPTAEGALTATTSRFRRRRDPSPSNASRRARPGTASTWRRRRSCSTSSGSRSRERHARREGGRPRHGRRHRRPRVDARREGPGPARGGEEGESRKEDSMNEDGRRAAGVRGADGRDTFEDVFRSSSALSRSAATSASPWTPSLMEISSSSPSSPTSGSEKARVARPACGRPTSAASRRPARRAFSPAAPWPSTPGRTPRGRTSTSR